MSRKKWYRRFPSLKPPKKFKTDDMLIIVRRLKFAEGQRHVEGIFPGFEIRRPIAVPVLWIINTAETQPPLVVPVTDIVRDKGVASEGSPTQKRVVMADLNPPARLRIKSATVPAAARPAAAVKIRRLVMTTFTDFPQYSDGQT